MKGKQVVVIGLLLVIVVMGIRQMIPTIVAMTGSALYVIGIVALFAVLGYFAYKILQD
jgi:hypothetical protein